MKRWRLGLAARLTLVFVLFAAALLAALGGLAYANGRASLQAATESELLAQALAVQTGIDNWAIERLTDLTSLAGSPALLADAAALAAANAESPEARAAHDRLLSELQPRAGPGRPFVALLVMDPATAQVLLATNPGEEGQYKETLPYFTNGLNGPYIQNVYYSTALNEPGMTVSAPLRTVDGRVLGVLAGRLDLLELNAIVQRRTGVHQTDDAFLVNTAHLFVTQPRLAPDATVLLSGVHTEAVNRCLAQTSGTVEALDYRGLPALIVYRWLPARQMCLIVKLDQAEAFAPVRAFGQALLLFGGLALLLATATAIWLAQTYTRPVRALHATAVRFGTGELTARAPETQADELGALGHEFNQMAAALAAESTQLRQRTERLYTLSANLIAVAGFDGYFKDLNPAWEQTLGFSHAELLTRPFLDFVHPDDQPAAQAALAQLAAGLPAVDFQIRLQHRDGAWRWLTWNATAEAQQQLIYAVGHDVTAQRQADEALRDRERKLATVLDLLPVGLSIIDGERRLVYANRALENILSVTQAGLVRGDYRQRQYFRPDGTPMPAAEFASAQALQQHQAVQGVITGVVKEDGRMVWTEVSAVPVDFPDWQVVIVTTDITRQKLADEALRDSEEKFKYLFDHSPVGKSLTQAAGGLQVNQAFGAMLGYAPAELQNIDWQKVTHPDDIAASREIVATFLAGRTEPARFTKRYFHKTGGIVWADVSTLLRRAADGQPLYFLTVVLDITARKAAEDALVRQAEELRRSNAELEQFAYVASHDLQEPLRMVSSFVQLLAQRYQGQLDADADEFIGFAVDGANRMKRLIGDLLAYSRVGTRGQELTPTDTDAVVQQALSDQQLAIQEAGAVVTHTPLPTVLGDRGQLAQLFQNLIGNALKFHGAQPPRVHITAVAQDKEWLFSVADNGIGLDMQYAERIFVIFQRLHGKDEFPGTGIGLAICKKIVERHSGRLWVESQPGHGATFYFTLPAPGSLPALEVSA